jgi:uncharacterized protein
VLARLVRLKLTSTMLVTRTMSIASLVERMAPSFTRYTIVSAIACCGCTTQTPKPEAPKPAEAPIPALMDVVEGFVNGEEIRCSWGLADSCLFAGEAHDYGMGVPRDQKRALSYFQRACSLGLVNGCVKAGIARVELGDQAHLADALAVWEEACEKGSYAGCHAAGMTLAFEPPGMGTPSEVQRARMYLAKACAARFLRACGVEAVLVVYLKETSSYATAREKLEEACKLRERESCHYLAQLELDGTFGPVDERTAGQHFFQACNGGWGAACAALAYLWANGIGTSVNPDKAKKLTAMACALKYEPACEVHRDPTRQLPPP